MALQTTILRGNISNAFVMGVTFTATTVATSGASKTVTVAGLKVGDAVQVTLPAAQTTGVAVAKQFHGHGRQHGQQHLAWRTPVPSPLVFVQPPGQQ